MTMQSQKVNEDTAPIKNVATCLSLIRSLQGRKPLAPNLAVFAGFSGYGKSVAALYCQNKTAAAYIEPTDNWTRKKLMQSILSELGVYHPKGTLADLEDHVIGVLARDPKRPLIIDEADMLIKRGMIETVRMIAKKSGVPVLLIGEEHFPERLDAAGDRFRDLVLISDFAQPCDLDDARTLGKTLYPTLIIADDLLQKCIDEGDGRVRRVCNSLHGIAEAALRQGLSGIDLAQYGTASAKFSRSKLPTRKEAA